MNTTKDDKKTYFEELGVLDALKKQIKLNVDFDLDKTLNYILDDIYKKFRLEGITIFLLTKDRKALKMFKYFIKHNVLSQDAIDELSQMELPIDSPVGGMATWVMHNNTHFYAKEIDPEKITTPIMNRIFELTHIKSNLFLPLEVYGEMLGIITFPAYTDPLDLNDEDIASIRDYVRYASIAISSNFLYEELKETHLELSGAYYELKITKKLLEDRKESMDKELEIARQIQMNFLPVSIPESENFEIAVLYKPMDQVGGDFYDFIQTRENEIGVFLSDVSGHGVPAAFITSMVKMAISDEKFRIQNPKVALEFLNENLVGKTNMNFLTAFYVILNFEENNMTFSNAAHEPALLYKHESNEIIELKTKGRMLGVFDDAEYHNDTVNISSGDRLLIFTDGVTEAVNKNKEMFELERVKEMFLNFKQKPIDEFIDILYDTLVDYHGKNQFEDDIAIIGIEIK